MKTINFKKYQGIGNDFIIPSNNDVFKENYKWQFYKYKWKNIGLSNNNNVYYSKIYLGDDTNTNIELQDLLESTDTAANVVIMIKTYDVDTENSYSEIWESPFFLGVRGSQGYREGQQSTMNILIPVHMNQKLLLNVILVKSNTDHFTIPKWKG